MSVDPPDLEALRRRSRDQINLRPIVFGQAVSLFGDQIAYFTLPYFVVTLTGSALDLGLTSAFETLPMLLFGLAAGVYLDRARLRRTLVFADAARALAFLLLAVAIAADAARPLTVFGVAFVVGSMSVVFDSGLQALLPTALSDTVLVTANARLQLARTLAFILGPAVAGLLIARPGGFQLAFILNACTFLASAVFLTMVRTTEAPRVVHGRFRAALGDGLGFLWGERRLRWATIGGAVTNLVFAPLEAVLVLFVTERLAGTVQPPAWLDWAFSALAAEVGLFFALQAIIGSIGVAVAPAVARRMPLGRMFVLGLVMLGAGFLVVAFSSTFWAVIPAGVALTGVSWVNVALNTLRQRLTPADKLGRVIAASRTISWIGLPVGAATGGALADAFGLVPLYAAGSVLVIVVALALVATPLWSSTSPDTSSAAPAPGLRSPDAPTVPDPTRPAAPDH
jgi:MFS family permease